jgi:hypothetical protein
MVCALQRWDVPRGLTGRYFLEGSMLQVTENGNNLTDQTGRFNPSGSVEPGGGSNRSIFDICLSMVGVDLDGQSRILH